MKKKYWSKLRIDESLHLQGNDSTSSKQGFIYLIVKISIFRAKKKPCLEGFIYLIVKISIFRAKKSISASQEKASSQNIFEFPEMQKEREGFEERLDKFEERLDKV